MDWLKSLSTLNCILAGSVENVLLYSEADRIMPVLSNRSLR